MSDTDFPDASTREYGSLRDCFRMVGVGLRCGSPAVRFWVDDVPWRDLRGYCGVHVPTTATKAGPLTLDEVMAWEVLQS